ncbi:hypothetical protein ILUMI_25203 [Ignelater luminosus]|uniref:Uncharacterized protein n=1 Tax=Ignelater luminosus TaxID=2038154 RepID=A0A8K0CB09_IGNLU|nr:hypothetical protein ILUMI_25203 [Ignelater luminosus]
MDAVLIDTSVEEREEGEIIDDLEDVSDCSMFPGSPLFSGKSVSPPELLSAVCLSSISTSEYSTTDGRSCIRDSAYIRHHDRNEVRHRVGKRRRKSQDYVSKRKTYKRTRHHRKSLEGTETDSEDEIVDPKYARKLRVALRRESSHDLLHNSLKTRLKAFIEPDSQSEDDLSLATLRELAFATIKNTENVNKQESNVESEIEKPQDESFEVKNNQEEDEISDIEPPELEEIPIILDSKEETDSTCKTDETISRNQKQVSENGDDSELNELRLAALKTVIMEKHKRRKKRMAVENVNTDNVVCTENVNKSDGNDVDKENDKSMINNDLDGKTSNNKILNCDLEKDNDIVNKEQVNTLTDVNDKKAVVDDGNCSDCVDKVEIEEDADILRAVLLASMTKKLADKTPENNLSPPLGALTLAGIRKVEKSKMNHNSLTVTIAKPKPLLRTIKNDIYRATNTNHINNLKINKISEQPHCIVKPLIIKVNDSDSDTENLGNESNKSLKATVTEFLKKQRAEVEAGKVKLSENSETSLNKSDDVLTEKSVVKLLPRSQQLEYRRLKQLLNARKRNRIRRHSQKLSESKREKVPKLKTDASNPNTSENTNTSTNIVEKKNTQSSSNLQKTLSDMQIRKNGRLQMKGKYRSLALLLNRINQASNERQQHEIEIKTLLQQIEKARMKLAASHQNFTNLVQQLLSEKNKIDKRMFKMVKPLHTNIFTSTPNKFIKKAPACNVSCPKESSNVTVNDITKVDNNLEEIKKR